MSHTAARLAAAVGALGLAALALPASAAAPAYSPGDVVTVDGSSVTAPAAGNSVALVVDRITGDSTTLIVATSADGTVTVSDGTDATAPAAPATPDAPNKCNDSAYSLLGGVKWQGAYNWRFKSGSTPNELTKTAATKALKASMSNITGSDNKCGMSDQVSARANYKGSTTAGSDVNSQPACDPSPNFKNVTEFGPIGGGGILAATCTYSSGNEIVTASVRINTNFKWWIKGNCTSAIGLKAVQTHEYGHAFGLGHVDESTHGNLTMSTNINGDCSNFEASLGRGDVLGLRDLY